MHSQISHHSVPYIIIFQFAMHSQILHHSVPWQPWLLVEPITTGHYLAGDILFVGWGAADTSYMLDRGKI